MSKQYSKAWPEAAQEEFRYQFKTGKDFADICAYFGKQQANVKRVNRRLIEQGLVPLFDPQELKLSSVKQYNSIFTKEIQEEIHDLYMTGLTLDEVGRKVGLQASQIAYRNKRLNEAGLKPIWTKKESAKQARIRLGKYGIPQTREKKVEWRDSQSPMEKAIFHFGEALKYCRKIGYTLHGKPITPQRIIQQAGVMPNA